MNTASASHFIQVGSRNGRGTSAQLPVDEVAEQGERAGQQVAAVGDDGIRSGSPVHQDHRAHHVEAHREVGHAVPVLCSKKRGSSPSSAAWYSDRPQPMIAFSTDSESAAISGCR
jgi:hypothetical protein